VLALLAAGPARAALPASVGDWLTEDKRGIVHVGPCGAGYCGTVVGISDWLADGSPIKDVHGVSECQMVIIRVAPPGDDGRMHGTVTDPEDGKVYDAEMWVAEDGDLRLRGYVGVPLFGSTQRWAPFHGTRKPDCHFSRS
jgi:uncharacterized protein (DUF2147 family)